MLIAKILEKAYIRKNAANSVITETEKTIKWIVARRYEEVYKGQIIRRNEVEFVCSSIHISIDHNGFDIKVEITLLFAKADRSGMTKTEKANYTRTINEFEESRYGHAYNDESMIKSRYTFSLKEALDPKVIPLRLS